VICDSPITLPKMLTSFLLQLEKEYNRISPLLKALSEKEFKKGTKHLEESQSLGFSQAFEYGELSNIRFFVPVYCCATLLTCSSVDYAYLPSRIRYQNLQVVWMC